MTTANTAAENQTIGADAGPTSAAFIEPARRLKVVDLDFPVQHAGCIYSRIEVRRLTVSEVGAFVETMRAKEGSSEIVRWPMTFDDAGAPIPAAVLDGLDDDDALKIDEAIQDFLPRRFKGNPQ